MRKIIIWGLFIISGFNLQSQSFSQLSFKTVSGDSVALSSFAGKKTLFLIVPLNQSDPIFGQVQAFKNRYHDTIRIVGVLSIEDGFQSSDISSLQNMYNSLDIVLTEGSYTKKTSGANQSQLMKWLTSKSMNMHFDMDASGIGHKFFVNESGRLFGVMPPQTPLNASIIDRVVHSNVQ